MRNKFLGTGQQGFNLVRKLRVAFSGLRYAILNESSVAIEIIDFGDIVYVFNALKQESTKR